MLQSHPVMQRVRERIIGGDSHGYAHVISSLVQLQKGEERERIEVRRKNKY